MKVASHHGPWELTIPGPYLRRWAPFESDHGLAQGQLPKESIIGPGKNGSSRTEQHRHPLYRAREPECLFRRRFSQGFHARRCQIQLRG